MRAVFTCIIGCFLFSSVSWAVEPTPTPTEPVTATAAVLPATVPQTLPANKPTTMRVASQPNAMMAAENAPLTAEQQIKNKVLQDAKIKALVKDQHSRLQQLEKANLDALAQNQELQLKNDSLGVQVQVLQSERSAQMFLYGAVTIAVGVLLGFLMASYIHTKRRRQW